MGFLPTIRRINEIQNLETAAELIARTQELSSFLGFEYCAFFLVGVSPLVEVVPHVHWGCPAQWVQRYIEGELISADPVISYCLSNTSPLIWGPSHPSHFKGKVVDIKLVASFMGAKWGIVAPAHDCARHVGVLSLSSDLEDANCEETREELATFTHLLAGAVHSAAMRIFSSFRATDVQKLLSARELECLRWVAKGKTSWEIARILGIAERTAIFHIENSVKKLGAKNRAHAIARASGGSLYLSANDRPRGIQVKVTLTSTLAAEYS